MKDRSAKQTLVEDIKKEIIMDLNRTYGQHYQEQDLVDSIKKEVLMELDPHYYRQQFRPNRAFIEAVKNEILSEMQGGKGTNIAPHGGPVDTDRAAIESIKKEVLAQIEAEQEIREESYTPGPGKTAVQRNIDPDPALIQAVKNSVMAEMNMPRNK